MSKVLIIGATGYIGQAFALSLLRSGLYTVYGLARTPEKARALQALEIIPVSGSATDSAAYTELIRREHIDIVVDAAGANMESKQILADLVAVGTERLAAAEKTGVKTAKLGFIYVSGMWVHGSSPEAVSDLDLVGIEGAKTQPPALVAWRPRFEQDVLAASGALDVMVVRPAMVYGGAGWIWSALFGPIAEAAKSAGTAKVAVDEDVLLALVHVDDVGSALHAAVEKLPAISGTGVYPVFDIVTSVETMGAVLGAAGKVMGYRGPVEYVGPGENVFMQAMNTSLNVESGRARTVLGWVPRRLGMVAKIETLVRAWEAGMELAKA
ncbi:hypothetical protein MMC19_002154 [Ptychographa xylographoides]|nr:hypothetical protein [Ptychographa xylographoides]